MFRTTMDDYSDSSSRCVFSLRKKCYILLLNHRLKKRMEIFNEMRVHVLRLACNCLQMQISIENSYLTNRR